MLERVLLAPFQLPPWAVAAVFGMAGGILSALLTRIALASCDEPDRGWSRRLGLVGVVLTAAFTLLMLRFHVQETTDVRPSAVWWYWRIGHHVVLLSLMLAVTATDLRAHFIPDTITFPGTLYGIALAALSGDLQLQHLWIDWNQEVPQIAGPFVPDWIKVHPHLHGLAWSLAGALAGAGVTWLTRTIARRVLGREALGLGDVTLMAMIGSFVGWQPVTVVLLVAPLAAVTAGVALGWSTGRPFLPFGPFLCLAATIVLFCWRWIWMLELSFSPAARPDDRLGTFSVRHLFGDWPSLVIVGAVVLAALVVLLALRRAYRSIPVTSRRSTL